MKAFSFMLLCLSVQAKEVWIQVIGIDEKVTDQNPESFYYSIRDFSNFCKLKKGRICETYVNPNPSLASADMSQANAKKILSDLSPTLKLAPTKDQILKRIELALKSAGEGDQILISLENHGAPSRKGIDDRNDSGKSCVYIDSSNCISEAEISEIIKKFPLPKNANLALVVNACYSGGFHDLMAQNVCIATTSDQYYPSMDSILGVWSLAQLGDYKRFADFGNNSEVSLQRLRTSEQVFHERKCLALRNQLTPDEASAIQSVLIPSTDLLQTIHQQCQGTPKNLGKNMKEAYDSFVGIISRTNYQNFESVCSRSKNLKPICFEIMQMRELLTQRMDLALQASSLLKANANLEGLRDLREQRDSLTLDQETILHLANSPSAEDQVEMKRKLDLLNNDQRMEVLKYKEKYEQTMNSYKINSALAAIDFRKTTDGDLELTKKLQYYQNCFVENTAVKASTSGEPEDSVSKFNRIAKLQPKKVFTPTELEMAKKCESNFPLR